MIEFEWASDIAHVVPIVRTLRTYKLSRFYSDLLAGVTVMFILIPQSLAYAQLAGVPPIWGLYAATFPLYVYAIFGTSKHIIYGPFAVTCFMLGDIAQKYEPKYFVRGSIEHIKFILYISWVAGLMFLFMWFMRMGNLVTLVTPNVMSSFVTGCALLVWFHQIPNTLGFSVEHSNMTTTSLGLMVNNFHKTTNVALFISIPTYIFLYGVNILKRRRKTLKKNTKMLQTSWQRFITFTMNMSFFVAFTGGYLTAKIIVDFGGEASKNLKIVGHVPSGFQPPVFEFPHKYMPADVAIAAIADALTLVIVSGMTNWSIVKKFAEEFGYEVDIQNELFASGILNILGSLLGNSFFNAGGLARSAIGVESGSRSQISNVIAATLIILAMLFFSQDLQYIPLPTLGVITMVGVSGLIDFEKQLLVYKKDKKEAAVMMVTTLVTFWLGLSQGIVLGVIISLLSELYGNSYPRIVPLGLLNTSSNLPAGLSNSHLSAGHVSMGQLRDKSSVESNTTTPDERLYFGVNGRQIPRINICRIESPTLYFGNAEHVCSHLRHIASRSNTDFHTNRQRNRMTEQIIERQQLQIPHTMEEVLIVDVSLINQMDEASVIQLNALAYDFQSRNVYIAYVQGPQFYEQVLEKQESELTSDPASIRKNNTASLKIEGVEKWKEIDNRDSIINTYITTTQVSLDRTHFSTASHMASQLLLCGAHKYASNNKPITHFASLDDAVKYFSFNFYLQTIGGIGMFSDLNMKKANIPNVKHESKKVVEIGCLSVDKDTAGNPLHMR